MCSGLRPFCIPSRNFVLRCKEILEPMLPILGGPTRICAPTPKQVENESDAAVDRIEKWRSLRRHALHLHEARCDADTVRMSRTNCCESEVGQRPVAAQGAVVGRSSTCQANIAGVVFVLPATIRAVALLALSNVTPGQLVVQLYVRGSLSASNEPVRRAESRSSRPDTPPRRSTAHLRYRLGDSSV